MRNGSLIAALVVAFDLSGPALAQDAESAAERPERGDRVERRLDRQGDVIDRRLDRVGCLRGQLIRLPVQAGEFRTDLPEFACRGVTPCRC
jgi:hypothetical protein